MFVFVLPIGYAGYQSFLKTERSGLGLGAAGAAKTVFAGLDNYRLALDKPEFIDGMVRVLGFAFAEVPLMIGSAMLLALLLDAASARGVADVPQLLLLALRRPGRDRVHPVGLPLRTRTSAPSWRSCGHVGLHLDPLGSGTATFWSIANIVTWEFAGYNMLILVAQLKAIDGELYEAARIDGANAWHEIRHIKLPLIRPAIVLTTIFTIIGTLQLFAEPFVLKGEEHRHRLVVHAEPRGVHPGIHQQQPASGRGPGRDPGPGHLPAVLRIPLPGRPEGQPMKALPTDRRRAGRRAAVDPGPCPSRLPTAEPSTSHGPALDGRSSPSVC